MVYYSFSKVLHCIYSRPQRIRHSSVSLTLILERASVRKQSCVKMLFSSTRACLASAMESLWRIVSGPQCLLWQLPMPCLHSGELLNVLHPSWPKCHSYLADIWVCGWIMTIFKLTKVVFTIIFPVLFLFLFLTNLRERYVIQYPSKSLARTLTPLF